MSLEHSNTYIQHN